MIHCDTINILSGTRRMTLRNWLPPAVDTPHMIILSPVYLYSLSIIYYLPLYLIVYNLTCFIYNNIILFTRYYYYACYLLPSINLSMITTHILILSSLLLFSIKKNIIIMIIIISLNRVYLYYLLFLYFLKVYRKINI